MSNSLTDILSALQNGVVAINTLNQRMQAVTSTSSGVTTIRLTAFSSA